MNQSEQSSKEYCGACYAIQNGLKMNTELQHKCGMENKPKCTHDKMRVAKSGIWKCKCGYFKF